MKKLILTAFIASTPFTAFAAGGHGPAGCGLGSHVIFKQADEWHEHVLAATTNGTSGNQTFGMTSGTLGCESANGPLASGVNLFIDDNLEQLASESASGHGETLAALSELIGIQSEDQSHFTLAMKANFDQIFAADSNSATVYDSIVSMMQQDITLAKYLG